jgi:hypothetical protein
LIGVCFENYNFYCENLHKTNILSNLGIVLDSYTKLSNLSVLITVLITNLSFTGWGENSKE